MTFKLISCEIFYREMCAAVARNPHRIDIEFLPKGLHDLPPGQMPARVQAAIDAVPATTYDAVLLGFGLCNNSLAGITAGELSDLSVQHQLGMTQTMEELIDQYGEDNAEYLYEPLCNGNWNEKDFLTVPPGSTIKACHDDRIVTC